MSHSYVSSLYHCVWSTKQLRRMKWVHDTFPEHRHFAWQEGYGAFSIGISQVDVTVSYITGRSNIIKNSPFRMS